MSGEGGAIETRRRRGPLAVTRDMLSAVPVPVRIVGGVALNIASGGLLNIVGSALAGHAAYEAVDKWATKKSEEVKRGKWLHAQMAKRKWLRRTVAGAAGLGVAAAAYFAGEAVSEVIAPVAEAQAATAEPTFPHAPLDASVGGDTSTNIGGFEIPTVSLNPEEWVKAWMDTSDGDKLMSIGEAVLLYDAGLSAFAAKRPPRRLSLWAAGGLGFTTAGAYLINAPFTAGLAAVEAVLYLIAAARGSGKTGLEGHPD